MSTKETNISDLSPEQLQELKDKQQIIMEDQLPYLRVEEEYERLQASIEKSRFEQLVYRLKWAEMKVGQNEKPTDPLKQ